MIVSFKNYDLVPRFDGKPWTEIIINESDSENGPWTPIDTQDIDPVAFDPSDPEPISFTTENATLEVGVGWYRVDLQDGDGNIVQTDPVFNAAPIEIMASLDDVNAHLDGQVIEATADNSDLVQVSVARVIRGYLSGTVPFEDLMSWQTPDTTPEIIREVAGRWIAAQVYFNESSRTSLLIPPDSFAQILYNEGMTIINHIIDGTISIIPPPNPDGTYPPMPVDTEDLTTSDFWPIDDCNRAFTVGMQL